MSSVRETALSALIAALSVLEEGEFPPRVERNAVLPEKVGAGGLVILRDGDPGEPEITLSPPRYHYEHEARLDLVVQPVPATVRTASLDTLARSVATALAADRTLGSAVDWLEWSAPQTSDLAVDGAGAIAGAVVTVTLFYSTPDPLA
ncbi:MAG: acyl-CoA transferase [Alphaproteobacteria bacterium]